jgi:hypothetical protein
MDAWKVLRRMRRLIAPSLPGALCQKGMIWSLRCGGSGVLVSELSKADIGAEKIDGAQHSVKTGEIKPIDVLEAAVRAHASLVLALSELLANRGGEQLPGLTIHYLETIAADTLERPLLASLGAFKAALVGTKAD